jgi:glycosyltransferase involved in cell wall biosynthesis
LCFYAEYNLRLFFYLLRQKADIIGAIDLDTALPCLLASRIRSTQRLYDAHELFCEMKEVSTRPVVHAVWKWIEKLTLPHFKHGYTVNQPIAREYKKMYGNDFDVIRNVPLRDPVSPLDPDKKTERYFIYQGAVNEGRCFETLIPAFQWVEAQLIICGDGNFMRAAKKLVADHQLEEKVLFKGMVKPEQLREITRKAWAGITLFDRAGKSNYLSLANRFFDYIQAGIPQLCVDYPVYRELNNSHPVAVLLKEVDTPSIAEHLNRLLQDKDTYERLRTGCLKARDVLVWEQEEQKLISYFEKNLN